MTRRHDVLPAMQQHALGANEAAGFAGAAGVSPIAAAVSLHQVRPR